VKIDINKALEQLAEGLGVTIDKLYPLLYKQAIISGIFNLFWVLFFITAIGSFILAVRYVIKKQKTQVKWEWDWDESRQIGILFGGIVLTVIGLFAIPFCLESAITAFFNTEYYMLDKILSKISGN